MNGFKTCIAFGNVPQYKEFMISLPELGSDYDYEETYIRHNDRGNSIFHTACLNNRYFLIK